LFVGAGQHDGVVECSRPLQREVCAQGVSETGKEELDLVRLGDRGAAARQHHEAFGEVLDGVLDGAITAEKGEFTDCGSPFLLCFCLCFSVPMSFISYLPQLASWD
jgi:hypothetical protein